MAVIINVPALIAGTWTAIKTIIVNKGLAMQYEDDGTVYTIFAFDTQSLAYTCTIWKGEVPEGVINGGYAQATNDADKAEFELTYKGNANAPIGDPVATLNDGYVTTVGTTNTAILASTYTEQTSNAQRSIVSSDANDTSAGTGARSVKITYYDQNMNGPYTETVTMNGTSPVDTTNTNICFIEAMCVNSVGANGGNAGNISLKASTGGGGATIGSIVVGDNETNWCHHYIPTGKTFRLVQVLGNNKGSYSGIIRVRRFKPTVANYPDTVVAPALRIPAGGQEQITFATPVSIRGPGKIVLYAQADGGTGNLDWIAGFMYFET